MALRNLSGRRMALLWAYGCALQLAVYGGVVLNARATETPEARAAHRRSDSLWAAVDAQNDSIERGLRPPIPEASPEQKEALRAMLRDSLGITWETVGNHTTVHLPPRLDSAFNRGMQSLTSGLTRVMLLAAALFLPIPLALVVTTTAWLFFRLADRRARQVTPAG
jgi:hypothetical protein